MGVNIKKVEVLNQSLSKVGLIDDNFRLKKRNLRSLELGNLYINNLVFPFFDKYNIKHHIDVDKFLKEIGFKDAIRIDLNGNNRALKLNLAKDITKDIGKFDLIWDCGTSEHVKNQYYCAKNIYRFCKVGGLILHCLPPYKTWGNHGIWRYSIKFFYNLAKECGYKILINEIKNHPNPKKQDFFHRELHVAMVKKYDGEFMSENKFKSLTGLY